MAQTELMLRLLDDGKIVGYEWHLNVDGLVSTRRKNLCCKEEPVFEEDVIGIYRQIPYDSFEQGIKVGDTWWFEGDEFLAMYINTVVKFRLFYGNWNYGYGFWWRNIPEVSHPSMYDSLCLVLNFKDDKLVKPERIGNIHEDTTNAK